MGNRSVLVAPQAFKGSADAREVASAISKGVKSAWPDAEITELPIADGGDGTLDVLLGSLGGELQSAVVNDPLGRKITAEWGIADTDEGKVALLDLARVSGLALLEAHERNPLNTSTYGFGELFLQALNSGCRRFIAGIGGSATNDGGSGMAEALGVSFRDGTGNTLKNLNGGVLQAVQGIDSSSMNPQIKESRIEVMCDVTNPLLGEHGATRTFGPQKGASPTDLEHLEAGLSNLARVILRDLGKDVSALSGAGAAGGLGGGLVAFVNAELREGAELVLDLLRFEKHLQKADLVIVGEGRFDASSAFNKAPMAAAKRAKKGGVPVIGIGGQLGDGHTKLLDQINALFSLEELEPNTEKAIRNAPALLSAVAEKAANEAVRRGIVA